VPLTFFKKKYGLFILGILSLLILFSVLELVISKYLVFDKFEVGKGFSSGNLSLKNILISGIGNQYIILVFFAIKAGRYWYSAQTIKDELVQSKLETDLEIYRHQLQPKLIYTLIEELEQLTEKEAEKVPEVIVKISNFLNRFLFEVKTEMIPLQIEYKLIEDYIEIHKMALGKRLKSNIIVNGLIDSYVVPPLLLLPFINSSIKIGYECNNSFESTVIIKAEKKYLLFSFTFWSSDNFRLSDKQNIEITKQRLNYKYHGKYRLVENIDDNFREVSLEIFY